MSADTYSLIPVARVRSGRATPTDDLWGNELAVLELEPHVPTESLDGLDAFSHVEVLFVFDRVRADQIATGARHPRGNPAWPKVGIFAQRAKDRPNRLGSCIAELVGREGRTLRLRGLDAIEGTPVVDIKPVFAEFLPRSAVRQAPWSKELMRDYWFATGEPKG
jgi:tRNA-Thr(GGU) m(6)t(6)A37 methyltransferase TsaA